MRWYHGLYVAGIAVLLWAAANALTATAEFWTVLFDKNPGLATTFVSSFLLPIVLLIVTNRQATRVKSIEAKITLDKAIAESDVKWSRERKDRKFASDNVLHSSLVKLLFEVQRLHIQLSSSCVDYSCIDKAVENFNLAFTKYQAIISDNQLDLSPEVTNLLYSFYSDLSSLLIELNDFKAMDATDLAIVSVYHHSQRLADYVIGVQELILKQRGELDGKFDRSQLIMVRQCCGREPSDELQEQYLEVTQGNDLPLTKRVERHVAAK